MSTHASDQDLPSVALTSQRRLEPAMATTSATFLATLENWLRTGSEILVLIRYPNAAGNKDFQFFSSIDSLSDWIRRLPPRTSVIAFGQRQLPIRGVVNESFVATCLSHIPDNSEFLMLETASQVCGEGTHFHWVAGESHVELRDALGNSLGVPVAVGLYPPWLADNNEVISAIVPDADGSARAGAY